jgi:predicted P-loop ATPase
MQNSPDYQGVKAQAQGFQAVVQALKAYPEAWKLTPVKSKAPYQKDWQKGWGGERATITRHLKSGKADGVGLLTGRLSGGIVALDCDGQSAIDHVLAQGIPDTVSFTSGKAGRQQLLLSIPEQYWKGLAKRKVITTGAGEQLEIRWDDHQSVLPPSAHPETEGYYWINSPEACPIAEAPLWVIEALLDEPKPEAPKPKPKTTALPPDVFPLEICLSKRNRELLRDGAGEGTRNDSGTALARDLIGTANRLDTLGHHYDGDPRGMFDDFCDRCTPPIAQKERESIWKSAQKKNPGPALSDEAIENCIAAWKKKNTPTGAEGEGTPDTKEADEKSMLAKRLERVQKAVGNRLRLNTLNKKIEFEGEQLDSDDLRVLLAQEKNLSIPSNDAGAIFKFIAQRNQYNPVVEYLERVSKEYGNDTSVLNGFAKRYFGQEEAIYDTYIRRFLVGAVARVMKPGCKLDSALFLQGDQGTFKSTFFKTLASEEWFDDSMGAASDKDERLKLHSVWIVEWAELETMFKRKDISAVKSFLTTTKDLIRPPYGRDTKEFKRQCVIVGTTNEDVFLKDPTGSRRFWVIPVQKQIPIDQLAQERDRIWAAAYALYKAGEQWHLTYEEAQQQAILNEYFQEVDPWQEAVWDYIQDRMRASTREILEMCIKKELRDTDKKDQMRIAAILQTLGWERSGQGKDGLGNKARLFRPKNISFLQEKVVTVVTPSPNPPLGKDSRVSQPSHNLSQPQGGVVTPPPPPSPLPEVTTSQPVTTPNEGDVTPSTPYGQGISAKVSQPSQPLDQHFEFFSDDATPATPCNTSNEGGVSPSNPFPERDSAKSATPATPLDQDLGFFSDQAPIPVDPNEELEEW